MDIDTSRWSGDGDLTQSILARLREELSIAALRVEDAPASHEDAGYTFISNEVFVVPSVRWRHDRVRRWGIWPGRRAVAEPAVSLGEIEALLTESADIGAPDFADEGMIQYLRTQRIVPAYQTRGYKLVELIRIYVAGSGQPL